jgi:hypothetical protein
MPWKSAVVPVVLALGAADMTTHTAFARGMSGGAHFIGGGFAAHGFAFSRGFPGHRFAINRVFVRPFRRSFFRSDFGFGGLGWWPYDYSGLNNGYGNTATTYAGITDAVPEPVPVPICHRSEEVVRVPAEAGGTSQIRVTNCAYGW